MKASLRWGRSKGWPCGMGRVREARDHGLEPAAAVAAPGEAGGMAFGVVGAGLPVGSGDRAPDVSGRGVDPLEGRHSDGLAPGAGADRPMVIPGMAEGGPAGEGVGHDLGIGGRPAFCATTAETPYAILSPARLGARRLRGLPGNTCEDRRRRPGR